MTITCFSNDETKKNEMHVMHRTRLYQELDDHQHCSLIGLVCDSGFGKTSLIRGYLSYKNMPALWCAFTEKNPPADDIRKVCDLLQGEEPPSAVVFDNCGLAADDPVFTDAILSLIDPSNDFTVFLLGQKLPKLPFTVMRVKEQYFELTFEELALDRTELNEYYNDYLGLALRDYELDFLADRTFGWFTSNQLIYLYLKKNRMQNLDDLDLNFLSDVTDINDYFSYSLFENQSPQMQDFMLKISPLTELDPDIINLLLEIDDAGQYLAELEQHQGFVYTDTGKTLRLHPLFRQFLYERYTQLGNNNYLSAHRRLSAIFEEKRMYTKAFAHAVACNDYISGIRLMSVISGRYNAGQLFNIINGHLEDISPDLLFSNTSMFLLRCIPETLTIQFIQPLDDAIKNESDLLWQANLQHRLGAIYFHLGNVNMSLELLEKSLASAGVLGNTEIMAFNYQLIADCHYQMGDLEQALRCARNALYLCEQNEIPVLQIHALEIFARLQLAMGNTESAEDCIAQAFEIADPDAYELFWLNAVQSEIDIAKGEPEQAVLHAGKAVDTVKDSICGGDIAYTNLMLARALISSGNTAEAKEHLLTAYDNSEHCVLIRYEVLSELVTNGMAEENAEEIRSEMSRIAEEHNFRWIMHPVSDTEQELTQKASQIIIRTLGSFSITYNGIPIKIKRLASLKLLHLLIINRGHYVNRDYIIEQLFPDSSLSSGANNLSVALSVLRKGIDTAAGIYGTDKSCILREKDRYCLNPDLITIDAEAFESSYKTLKEAAPSDLNKWLDLSVLYGEPFLQEYPYEPILKNERDRLSSYQKDVALTIARLYAQQNDMSNSLHYYEETLKYDPYDEDVYFEVIEMLLDNDAPARAQVIADKMKIHVEEELGVPCSEQIQTLFDYYYKRN